MRSLAAGTGDRGSAFWFIGGPVKILSGNPVPMARILLVEDDLDVCLLMEDALIDGGHAVDATGRVLAGFVLLGSHPFDLVVTDVRLPDGSGIEVADRAREKGIPTLIVTGYAFSLPKDDLNRFEFLLKPFRQKDLLRAVERVLQTELT